MVWWRKARKYGCSVMLPPRGALLQQGEAPLQSPVQGSWKDSPAVKIRSLWGNFASSKNLSKSYYLTRSENEIPSIQGNLLFKGAVKIRSLSRPRDFPKHWKIVQETQFGQQKNCGKKADSPGEIQNQVPPGEIFPCKQTNSIVILSYCHICYICYCLCLCHRCGLKCNRKGERRAARG